MYCDKDNQDRYSIMDLDREQFETIRRALTAYRVGLLTNSQPTEYLPGSEAKQQYMRAEGIVQKIENIQK